MAARVKPLRGTERPQEQARRRDRALIASAGAAVVARVAIAGGSLLSLAIAARTLTQPELGVVAVLTGLLVYAGLGDFGMGTLLMTKLPIAHARGDRMEMRSLVTGVTSVCVYIASVGAAVGVGSWFVVPWRRVLSAESIPAADFRWTAIVFLVAATIATAATVGTRILAALQRGALARTFSTVGALASVLAVFICAVTNAPMWAFMIAFAAPAALLGPVQLLYVALTDPTLRPGREVFDPRQGLSLVGDSVEYAVMSSGWVITYALDAAVVAVVLGAGEAATYAVAARMFGLVAGTLYLGGQQMWPALAEALARGDVAWVQQRFRQSVKVVAVAATGASLLLLAAGQVVARVWVGPDLVPPVLLLAALAAWTIYMAIITQFSYLLLAAHRSRPIAIIGTVTAVVNLAVSLVLTHAVGLSGPVLGSLAAALSVQLIPTVMLTRRLMAEISSSSGRD